MIRKFLLASSTILAYLITNAQDSTKSISFSGSVDGYYRTTFSDKLNNHTSFTNSQNSFELGMASLRADATSLKGKIGATIDLGYGRRVEENSYNDGSITSGKNGFLTLANIKQAFVTYAPSNKVKFTMGKFSTHIGYELIDASLNKNYSMSYMFTNGPFFNTGFKADISAGTIAFMIGVSNFTDQTTSSTSTKNVIAQISSGSKNGNIKYFLNYTGFNGSNSGANPFGLKALNQIDAVVTAILSKKINLGYNGTIQSRTPISGSANNWIGNAIYLNVDATEKIGITLRSEMIIDNNLIYFSTKNIFANTLSLNAKIGALIIIPEIRFESAQSNFYLTPDGTGTKSAVSAILAFAYKF